MKKMPRTHIEGAVYYVTSRGDHNWEIFKDSRDYMVYIEFLKKYKAQYGFKLFAFCLLPNHLHLLIELKKGVTISNIMHDLNSNYTKYFNGRYNKKGHLFQERNRTILAEKAPYLLAMTAYIHLNPKARNLVSEIKDYPYSSYPLYINGSQGGLNLDEEAKEIAEYLKGKTYADFLNRVTKEEMEILGGDLSKKLILGSEEFAENISLNMQKAAIAMERKPLSPRQKKFIFAGIAVILILGVTAFYLYNKTIGLRKSFNNDLAGVEAELKGRMVKDREVIYKDLDEKYRADLVSFQAMTKRLEIEKNKVKELEQKNGR